MLKDEEEIMRRAFVHGRGLDAKMADIFAGVGLGSRRAQAPFVGYRAGALWMRFGLPPLFGFRRRISSPDFGFNEAFIPAETTGYCSTLMSRADPYVLKEDLLAYGVPYATHASERSFPFEVGVVACETLL